MIKHYSFALVFVLTAVFSVTARLKAEEIVPLGSLDLSKMKQGWGEPKIDQAVTGKPMRIGGKTFEHGVGTHAQSVLHVELGGGATRFTASVGMDDSLGDPTSAVQFQIFGDGKTLFKSGVMKPKDKAKAVDIDLHGVKTLVLLVPAAGRRGVTGDGADWADAKFFVSGQKPKALDPPREEAVRLTPPTPPEPRINGPTVYGCRPSHPFIYRIPTTGERPMKFAADNLPSTFKLDAASGIITGTNPPRGDYAVTFHAENRLGKAERKFKIVSGDTLCLTPPMGWNSWYVYDIRVTDRIVREAAEGMVRNGMADAGYQYASIDDGWSMVPADAPKQIAQPARKGPAHDEHGKVITNKYFPDMKAMTDFIHSFGLKAGIYTSPGPFTCAGFGGAYGHEEQDARQFADWGFDMLKHDWCSYTQVVEGKKTAANLKKPYALMGEILKKQPRDIHLNLCQYGMGKVWEWGEGVGAQSWRTAGDLGFQLDRVIDVAMANAQHRQYSKPGSWNDPDYLQIGLISGDSDKSLDVRPCPLTPNEQYSFMSLWCLMASPLFFSGDVPKLDDFTLGILCNPEVIEIDQDPLGQCARTVTLGDEAVLFVKDMEDGSKAVGLCNRGEMEIEINAKWADLKLKGKQRVRDLWRQKELGDFTDSFAAKVGRHGTFLIRLWPK